MDISLQIFSKVRHPKNKTSDVQYPMIKSPVESIKSPVQSAPSPQAPEALQSGSQNKEVEVKTELITTETIPSRSPSTVSKSSIEAGLSLVKVGKNILKQSKLGYIPESE